METAPKSSEPATASKPAAASRPSLAAKQPAKPAQEPTADARIAWGNPARVAEAAPGSELALMQQLSHSSPSTRALAAFDLCRLESASPRASQAIVHRLEVERDPRVRTFLNESLVRLSPERRTEGMSAIQQAAHSSDKDVSSLATVVLADLKQTAR